MNLKSRTSRMCFWLSTLHTGSGQACAVATALTNDMVNFNNFNAKYGRKDIYYVKLFS